MPGSAAPATGHALHVVLYTAHRILRGALYQRSPIRLSDQVNLLDEDFMALYQEQATDLASDEAEAPSREPWYVARSEILMVHEDTASQEQAVSRGAGDRVQKRPVAVRCYVGPFRVEGQYYMVDLANMVTTLNTCGVAFVPLTSATITVPGRPGLAPIQTPFVLVNRARLIITGEAGQPGPLPGAR